MAEAMIGAAVDVDDTTVDVVVVVAAEGGVGVAPESRSLCRGRGELRRLSSVVVATFPVFAFVGPLRIPAAASTRSSGRGVDSKAVRIGGVVLRLSDFGLELLPLLLLLILLLLVMGTVLAMVVPSDPVEVVAVVASAATGDDGVAAAAAAVLGVAAVAFSRL